MYRGARDALSQRVRRERCEGCSEEIGAKRRCSEEEAGRSQQRWDDPRLRCAALDVRALLDGQDQGAAMAAPGAFVDEAGTACFAYRRKQPRR